jgi:hypothetical protein
MVALEKVSELVEALIKEGEDVLATKWQPSGRWATGPPTYVDLEAFKKWRASCRLLVSLMGDLGTPWHDIFMSDVPNGLSNASTTLGTLKAMNEALSNGYLVRFEELVLAEAFSDITEQAEYLLDQGYFLAAGVILRAVLEERLRKLCERTGCTPEKPRATISDLNQALYKAKAYDKIVYKHVDAMTATGNDAAHNASELKKDDVARLLNDVKDFLRRFAS